MSGVLRILSLVLLLAGALALVACGDDKNSREAKNAYVKELNLAQQEFATNTSMISQQGAKSIAQYRRTLRRFEDSIASFTSKLREIEVPTVVQDEHEQLIAALTSFGEDFKQVAGVLNNPNARTLSEAQSSIMTSTQRANARIEAAAAAIDSKLRES